MEGFEFCLARRAISALSLRAIRLAGQFFVVGGAAALLFLGASLTGGAALADCTPDPAAEGDTVTCTGTDTDGFASESDSVTVIIEPDAEVSGKGGDFATIKLGSFELPVDGSVVVNDGTIVPMFFDEFGFNPIPAIVIVGANNSITNNGLIDGIFPVDPDSVRTAGWGILITVPVDYADPTTEIVTNSGLIGAATGIAIRDVDFGSTTDFTAIVTNSGGIESTSRGVDIDRVTDATVTSTPFSTITSRGTGISVSGKTGFEVLDTVRIIQGPSSVISAEGDGIFISDISVADIELQSGSVEAPTLIRAGFWGINVQGQQTDATVTLRPDSRIESLEEFGSGGILIERAGDVSIFVEEGASITTGGGSAIRVNDADNLTIINDGALSSKPYAPTIWLHTRHLSQFNIVNNGTISTEGWTAFNVCCGQGTTIFENHGLIMATGDFGSGVEFYSVGEFLNTGTVSFAGAGGRAVGAAGAFDQAPVTVVNQGLLRATGGGLVLEGTAFRNELDEDGNPIVVDLPTQFFTHVQQAVSLSKGLVRNELGGVIEAPDPLSTAVRMTSWAEHAALLENYGTITGGVGSVARFDERASGGDIIRHDRFLPGAIEGGPGQDTVVNYGTVTGSIGLGDGDDSFTNTGTGVVNGVIDLGSGTNFFTNDAGGLISSIGNAIIAKDDSTIFNAGTIASAYAVDTPSPTSFRAAVEVGNRGNIHNTGTISVESEFTFFITSGVKVGGDNVVLNDGTIAVNQAKSPNPDALIFGVGILGGGPDNIIENNGLIDVSGTAKSTGIFLNNGSAVVNNGDINAVSKNDSALGVLALSAGSDIVNNGTITTDSGNTSGGIVTTGETSVVNNGTINGVGLTNGSWGILVQGDPGDPAALATILNTGSITADTAIAVMQDPNLDTPINAEIENTGTIIGDILLEGGNASLTNKSTGVITGVIDLGAGANTLTNEAGGLISAMGEAVIAGDDSTIFNAGTIASVFDAGYTTLGSFVGAVIVGKNNDVRSTGTISVESEAAITYMSGMLVGAQNTVRNDGTIAVNQTGAPLTGWAVGINTFGGNNVFENNGLIDVKGTASSVGIYSALGDDVTNRGNIGVVAGDGIAIGILGHMDEHNIVNDGTISVSSDAYSAAIVTIGAGSIVNNGTLAATGGDEGSTGLSVQGDSADLVSITNTGSITAETAIKSAEGSLTDGLANVTIKNTGTIVGHILFEGGNNTVKFGAGSDVTGDLLGGDDTDVLTLSGSGSFVGAFNGFEDIVVTGGTSNFNPTGASAVPVTTVNGGRLNLNGTLVTDATVNAGGALGGSGTLIGIVSNNGTVSPGNSIGTLTIDGDYTQGASGVLSVEIGAGGSDLLSVGGTASLDGILQAALPLDGLAALEGQSISVLTAGDVDGEFINEGTTRQGFWDVTVTTGPSDVQVSIGNIDIPLGATSPSVGALGGALASILGASSPASAQVTELSSSSIQSQQITGQASANLATATIGNTANFNSAILGRLEDARFAVAAESDSASFTDVRSGAPSWQGWVGYSFVSHFDREALERGARDNVLKFSGGADIALSPRARVGYALGLFSSDLDASRFAGDNQIDGVQASAYGAYQRGKAFLNTVFGVANNRFELERDIDFGFVKERLSGEADGTDVNATLEAGYDLRYRGVRVIPFASLQGVSSHREAYREDGGVFALNVAADTAYSVQSALGVKLGGNWKTSSGLKMSSRLKLAWAHEYLDHRRDVRVAFARLPEREFFLIGRGINRDALEIETEMGLRLTGQLNAVFKYRGLIGSRDTAHGITLGFNVTL